MADNIPTTTTSSVATDDIANVHYQRMKLTLGADGVNDGDVSSANPMPVEVISGGVVGLTDAELRAADVAITLNGESVAVTAAALPLPTGAATEATLAAIDADTSSLAGCVSGSELQVDIVSGTVNTSAQPDLVVEKIDQASATVTYIGQASPGTATSAASWRIQRMGVSGTVTTLEYADGDLSFNNIWDNRASLSYS